MKTSNFLSRVWDFFRKLFNPKSDDFKADLVIDKIQDEEVLADNMVQNYRERGVFLGSDFKGNPIPEELLLTKKEIVFDKKEPVNESVKVKKTRRILTYKIETKQGLILYEGKKITKFIEESELNLDFTQEEVYRFAKKYQATKIFKEKYFVSFSEVARK